MSEGPITHLTIVVTPKSRMKVRINSYAVFRASWASGTCCASLSWPRDSFIVNSVTFGALIDPPDIAVDGPFPRRSRSSVTAPGRPGLARPRGPPACTPYVLRREESLDRSPAAGIGHRRRMAYAPQVKLQMQWRHGRACRRQR